MIENTFYKSIEINDNNEYLKAIDEKSEKKQELDVLSVALKEKELEFEQYKFIELFGDNLRDRLLEIKYEQQSFEEKIRLSKEIIESIEHEESEVQKKRAYFLNIIKSEELAEEIIDSLTSYESKLKELKEKAYSEEIYLNLEKEKNNKKFMIIAGTLFMTLGGIILFIKSISLIISLILLIPFLTILS